MDGSLSVLKKYYSSCKDMCFKVWPSYIAYKRSKNVCSVIFKPLCTYYTHGRLINKRPYYKSEGLNKVMTTTAM